MKAIFSCINEVTLAVIVIIHHYKESVQDCFLKIPPFPFNSYKASSLNPYSLFSATHCIYSTFVVIIVFVKKTLN